MNNMNKKFRHVILASFLAFATIFTMASSASAQSGADSSADLVFVNRFNVLVRNFDQTFELVERNFGTARAITLSGAIVGINVSQLQLQASTFGLPINRFLMTDLIARSAGVTTTRVITSLGNRTFGEVALMFGVPLKVASARIGAFVSVFNSELALQAGIVQPISDDELIAILSRLFQNLDNRFNVFVVRLGDSTFDALLLARLALETNLEISTVRDLRFRFSNLTIGNFTGALLLASAVSAATLEEMGFILENFDVTTFYGAARALSTNGVPVQVMVSRVDTFQRIVRIDTTLSTTP
jgi:hypothetical protein